MRPDPSHPAPEPDNVISLASAKRRLRGAAATESDAADSAALLRALKDVASVRRVRPKKPLPLRPPPATPARFLLRVDLVGSNPPLWRQLCVPSNLTLDRLHDVLQTAFGWTNSHLHQFTLAADPYGHETEAILTAFDVEEGDEGVLESELRLDQLLASAGDTLHYTYDFGDDWEHTVALEAVGVDVVDLDASDLDALGLDAAATDLIRADAPTDAPVRCLAGERQGPPEDVGGIHNYEHILAVAANPQDPEYRDLIEVIASLELFDFTDTIDLDAINRGLDRLAGADAALAWLRDRRGGAGTPLAALIATVGEEAQRHLAGFVASARITEPIEVDQAAAEHATAVIRTFLRHVGDGIPLTAAGYLPPQAVIGLMAELDPGERWFGGAKREAHTRPLLALRETVTELGLVRRTGGVLVPTKLGAELRESPLALWRHLASRLPLGRVRGRDGALLFVLLVAAGEAETFRAMQNSLDLLTAIFGSRLDGEGSRGHGAAIYQARSTGDLLEWAGSGALLDPGPSMRSTHEARSTWPVRDSSRAPRWPREPDTCLRLPADA